MTRSPARARSAATIAIRSAAKQRHGVLRGQDHQSVHGGGRASFGMNIDDCQRRQISTHGGPGLLRRSVDFGRHFERPAHPDGGRCPPGTPRWGTRSWKKATAKWYNHALQHRRVPGATTPHRENYLDYPNPTYRECARPPPLVRMDLQFPRERLQARGIHRRRSRQDLTPP